MRPIAGFVQVGIAWTYMPEDRLWLRAAAWEPGLVVPLEVGASPDPLEVIAVTVVGGYPTAPGHAERVRCDHDDWLLRLALRYPTVGDRTVQQPLDRDALYRLAWAPNGWCDLGYNLWGHGPAPHGAWRAVETAGAILGAGVPPYGKDRDRMLDRFHNWGAGRGLAPGPRELFPALGLVLGGIPADRARLYAAAGITLADVQDLPAAGEDLDARLALLAGLRTGRMGAAA